LLASLLVAVTLLPMNLALHFRAPGKETHGAPKPAGRFRTKVRTVGRFIFTDIPRVVLTDARRLVRTCGALLGRLMAPVLNRFDRTYAAVSAHYPKALRWSLNHKASVIGLAMLLAVTAGLLASIIGAELIPPMTQGEFAFEIRLKEASPLEKTDRMLRDVVGDVREYPGVKLVFSSAGGSNKNQFARNLGEEHIGQLYVVMADKQNSDLEAETIGRVRARLDQFPDITYSFSRPTLFTFKTPIEVEIYAYDL
ncbi:MAG: efflux RND transporter permease subunit, partial [bacterium]|nr:efflux RND transporter permease subunit [bacterium]